MIVLFTDYGVSDPYSGLMKAAILAHAPNASIVDLTHCVSDFNVLAGAHLLAAMSSGIQLGSVCIAIVDPGVGSERDAVVMLADEKWYVAPDNGLLSVIAGRSNKVELWRIDWRPENLSVSFHGRDLFAPIGALIEMGIFPHDKLSDIAQLQVRLNCNDLPEVIYIDHFGNIMTGIRSAQILKSTVFRIGGRPISYARVFSNALPDQPFWYENSLGLVEFALNGVNAAQLLGAQVGDKFEICLSD